MKDFDEGRKRRGLTREERTFQIAGQTFVAQKSIHPSVLVLYDDINEDAPAGEILNAVDDMIVQMMEPEDDSSSRYHQVRAQKEDPVTLEDLMDIVKWIIEVASGRPTGQPADSSRGLTSTETASTESSSSPGEQTELTT